MRRHYALSLLISSVLAAGAGCASQPQTGPVIASSADQYGYASRFPNQLAAARTALDGYEGQLQTVTTRFAGYPGELDEPDWDKVEEVVRRADQAGRSSAYVSRMRETDTVAGFFEDEEEAITKKVGGAAQYAASQKGCKDSNAFGAVKSSLPKAVKKQLEERLREHNEAHAYLAEHEEALGKKNVEKLETHADEISYASYVAHVAVVELKYNLESWLEEASQVQTTLDDKIKEAQATLEDEQASEEDKKSAQTTLEAAQPTRQQLDSEVEQTQAVLEGIDERISKLQEQYQQALDALLAEIDKQRDAAEERNPAAAEDQPDPQG